VEGTEKAIYTQFDSLVLKKETLEQARAKITDKEAGVMKVL